MQLKLIIALHLFGLLGCQTSSIIVNSVPEGATVEVLNTASLVYEKRGVTPMEISEEQLIALNLASNDLMSLRVIKEGYRVEHIVVDKSAQPKIELNARLLESTVKSAVPDSKDSLSGVSKHANRIASKVQLVNSLKRSGKIAEAIQEMRELLSVYSNSYYLWDMKGSLHLLVEDKSQAIASFKQSLDLFPDNQKTRIMLQQLEAAKE